MMKVETSRESGTADLKVCGRITGCWVGELERAWQAAKAEHSGSGISIDLRGVSFIDAAGEGLLRSMHREGARFLTSGLLIQGIVNQITGENA
jgi:anti-anti-sigma regulatory factor